MRREKTRNWNSLRASQAIGAKEARKHWLYVIGAVGGIIALAVCAGLIVSCSRPSPEAPTPTLMPAAPTLAPTSAPPPTSAPEPEPAATHTAAPSATPTLAPTATPSATPMPEVAAVVGADGAYLRPGATTWWFADQTLPAGTELELIGFDPDFPDWVYIRTPDGDTGWVQIEKLEIHRQLSSLPKVTPRPTLRPVLATPTLAAPASCQSGFLRLSYWPMSTECNADGTWAANIFAAGRGGDCIYTYLWEDAVVGGPQPGPLEFKIVKPWGTAVMGNVSVTSAGQVVIEGLVVDPPRCP